MSVLARSDLEASPLADLHVIASELGLDSFRRMRKADLIDAIVERQGGDTAEPEAEAETEAAAQPEAAPDAEPDAEEDREPERPRRRRRGGRGRARRGPERAEDEEAEEDEGADGRREEPRDRVVEGTVELLGNGSGFARVSPPEPSDEDVYISAAQVRRCELVSGDVVTGPVRPPRRSERYPSMVRIDTINGTPADQVAEGTRYEDLPAAFPEERFALGSEDPTVRAIEWLTPFGRGSRVAIVGGARAGKTEALLRLAAALASAAEAGGYEVSVALAGARRYPALDLRDGGVVRPELRVGDAGAEAIAKARAEALGI